MTTILKSESRTETIDLNHEAHMLCLAADLKSVEAAAEELEHWFFDFDQYVAVQIFERMIENHGADWGELILMEVRQLAEENKNPALFDALLGTPKDTSIARRAS